MAGKNGKSAVRPIDPCWLRPGEAAQLLGLSRSAIYAMAKSGELPVGTVARWGRAVRFHRQRLLDHADQLALAEAG